jgi:hypothetical protein
MKIIKNILLTALVVYLFLTMLPFPINYVPLMGHLLLSPFGPLMRELATFCGQNVFGVETIPQTLVTGSGDTMLAYLGQFIYLLFSLLLSIFIQLNTSLSLRFQKIKPYLELLIRYWLAATLINYGITKLLPVQMQSLTLAQLLQPYGNMTPMSVLWKFMGLSPIYQSITGLVELTAGLLLCYRRTYILGLGLGLVAFTQVFLLNLLFDVPVKLQTSHYLLAFFYLLGVFIRSLSAFFLLQKPATLFVLPDLFSNKKLRLASVIFKNVFLAYVLTIAFFVNYDLFKQDHLDPNPALYGIFKVDALTLDGQVIEPLLTNQDMWLYIVFDRKNRIYIHKVSQSGPHYKYETDGAHMLKLTGNGESSPEWDVRPSGTDQLEIKGQHKGQNFTATVSRIDENKFPLWNRKFNWIQEYPNNR